MKMAIITGASRGLGRDLSIYLAIQGYFFVLIARNESLLEEVFNIIKGNGGLAAYYLLDVSNASSVKLCISGIVDKYGYIDFLINNAAILKCGTTDISDEEGQLLNIIYGEIMSFEEFGDREKINNT